MSSSDLNKLRDTPFEKWGVKLVAVSANANGIVQSGITKSGIYFWWNDKLKSYVTERK